jgi:pyruvate carboxylase
LKAPRVKAEAGNACHVGAPMPGLIAQINVRAGDEVSKGDALMTIEAMKMQTSIRAERDGRITEVAVQPGAQVESKDLLVVFA